jgi:hypothetical protein
MANPQRSAHVRTAAPRFTRSAKLSHNYSDPVIEKRNGEKVEGYCLKDKRKVEMKDPQPITMKNGKPATVGTCPICGTKIYRIGKAVA